MEFKITEASLLEYKQTAHPDNNQLAMMHFLHIVFTQSLISTGAIGLK